jgi:hypothetical protein
LALGLAPSGAGFERLREMFAEFNPYRVAARKRLAARPLIRPPGATFYRKGRRSPTCEIQVFSRSYTPMPSLRSFALNQ